MTDRELMDKAWDYLASYTVGERPNASEVNDFIAVIEDRMNQPEQELMIDCPRCGHCCPQTNQDPVGWFGYDTGVRAWFETNKGDDDSIPLYKAPRQWVGLTNEEIKSLPSWWPSYEDAPALIELVKDVEAKLKEKNT
jgi:hypothetical protein